MHSIEVMNQCKTNKDFAQFVRMRSSDHSQLTLSEFIKKPAQVVNLYTCYDTGSQIYL